MTSTPTPPKDHLEKLHIDNPESGPLKEDIVFKGVPIGRMTYGFNRFPQTTISYIRSIGRFCSIAQSVTVVGKQHPLDWVSTHPFLYALNRGFISQKVALPADCIKKNKPVEIGHDVWIGEGVRIQRSVKLGHGCVIATGSVVTKNVPPYAIVGGIPAKIIRYRVPPELIPKLLEIAWWNWPLEKIQAELNDFYDFDKFIKKHFKGPE